MLHAKFHDHKTISSVGEVIYMYVAPGHGQTTPWFFINIFIQSI